MRKPTTIEFIGTPNSGKTESINFLVKELAKMNLKVELKQEDAEIVPTYIPKKTWERNLWIAQGQVKSLIESKFSTSDVIFFDRGFFDAMFWANFLVTQGVCTKEASNVLKSFLCSLDSQFTFKPDFLFIIDVSNEVSIKRRCSASTYSENEVLVFSNNPFLDSYREELRKFYKTVDVPCFVLDTSNISIPEMHDIVLKKVKEILNDVN